MYFIFSTPLTIIFRKKRQKLNFDFIDKPQTTSSLQVGCILLLTNMYHSNSHFIIWIIIIIIVFIENQNIFISLQKEKWKFSLKCII